MANSAALRVTLLGTGTSTGVPVIGCSCPICTSTDSRNQRLRCSCWIRTDGLSIVIDTGPDFRRQALAENIRRVDAVLYTHHHFDHVAGIDELRAFCFGNHTPIPCYAPSETIEVLRNTFRYVFGGERYPSAPRLELIAVEDSFEVVSRYDSNEALPVIPIAVGHGDMPVFGYRIDRFAYLTDTNYISEDAFEQLADLDVLVLDALHHRSHPTHFTVEEAVDVARRVGARKTYFIHMTHTMDHATENEKLPEGIELGYDGLTFDVRN